MRLRRFAIVVLVAGCPSPPKQSPPDFCQPLLRAEGAFPFHDPLLGAPVTVPVAIAFDPCDGGMLSVDATAVVAGPDDAPVPSTVSIPKDPGGDPGLLTQLSSGPGPQPGQIAVAEVTFTPTVPGAHHLVVHFEPLSLNVQLDVETMIDRRPVTFHELHVEDECMEFALSNGAALCLDPLNTLRVVVDGGVTDQIGVYSFDADDQHVWAVQSGDAGSAVQVFTLSAAGKLTPQARLDPLDQELRALQASQLIVTASGERALLTSLYGVAEVTLDGGLAEGPFHQIFPGAPYAVQWVPGVGVVAGVTTEQSNGVCTARFDSSIGLSCGGNGIKYSDGRAVWLQQILPGRNTMSATTLLPDGGVVVSSSLLFSGTPQAFTLPFRVRATGPLVRDQTGIELAALAPDAVLEFYGAPPGDGFALDPPRWEGASATRYWEWHPSGRLLYFDR